MYQTNPSASPQTPTPTPSCGGIVVLWQSLVVKHYRSFFYHLKSYTDGDIHLLAPHRFRELGGQDIVCEPHDPTLADAGIYLHQLKVLTLHTQIVWFWGLTRRLRRLFKREGAQHYICLAEPYSVTALLAYCALVLSGHGGHPFYLYGLQNIYKPFAWPLRLIQSFLFRRCKAILVSGREQEDVLRQHGYLGHCVSFPLWFDAEQFVVQGSFQAQSALLKSINRQGIFDKPLSISFAGSWLSEKGLEDFFDAFSHLSDWKNLLNILIVGRGPEAALVNRRVNDLQKQNWNVHVLGSLSLAHMPLLFHSCDVLVVPSRTAAHWKEQFGRVIVEAEACGCRVVGSSSGAIPEVIGDAKRVFRECDPLDLARILSQELSLQKNLDPNAKIALREATRSRAYERFSDIRLAQRFAANLAVQDSASMA